MHGMVIRTAEGPSSPLPPGRRPFAFCFEPILPRLARFHWVSKDLPVQFVGEGNDRQGIWELIQYDETENARYFRPDTLLPKYAGWVTEDWNALYGFLERPDPDAFIKGLKPLERVDGHAQSAFIEGSIFNESRYAEHLRQHGSESGRYLARRVDLFFCNMDGAWWEMYANDESLLDSVRSHLKGVRGVTVTEQTLEFRPSW